MGKKTPELTPEQKKKRIAAARQHRKVNHETFTSEGTMIAHPLCFPGQSVSFPPDESLISALDVTLDRQVVYGGTSGRRVRIFYAVFHGQGGAVCGLQTLDNATECAAVVCGKDAYAVFANGPGGPVAVTSRLEPWPISFVQEWWTPGMFPAEKIEGFSKDERVVHALRSRTGELVYGVTDQRLFSFEFETGKLKTVAEVPGRGRLLCLHEALYGDEEDGTLWKYTAEDEKMQREHVLLPAGGKWEKSPGVWAVGPAGRTAYTADDRGRIYRFSPGAGFSGPVGQAPLAPVTAMAATFDGRLFGACGEEIQNIFSIEPGASEVSNLGVAISVIQVKRYGYLFADAATGRDGQIYFAEHDDRGHIWMYFPKIKGPGC